MPEFTPEQLQDLAKGGIWTDKNLAEGVDWAGEQGSTSASQADTVTYIPQTEKQQEDHVLALHKITPETIAILTRRIQQSLLVGADPKDSSLSGMVERKISEAEKRIDAWMEKKDEELMRKEVTTADIESLTKRFNKLDEKITSLEERLNHNLILATKSGSEEASVLHEVKAMLKERRAIDESETGSLPSIVDRLENRSAQILDTLNVVEEMLPAAENQLVATMQSRRNVRKKFANLKKLGEIKMAFPNTHAFAFTQMPKSLTKTWQKCIFRGENMIPTVPNPNRHRYSAVASIQLSIEFDEIADFMAEECARADDSSDDAIDLWKENRVLWRDLELSVENQISEYVNRIRESLGKACDRGATTYEAPAALRTNIQRNRPVEKETTYPPMQQVHAAPTIITLPGESVLTPDDSASVVNNDHFQKIISEQIAKAVSNCTDQIKNDLREKRKGKSSSSSKSKSTKNSSSSKAKSILSYVHT